MYTYFHYVVFEITCQGRMGGCDTLLKSSTPVGKTLLRVCHLSLSSRCVHDLIAGGRSVTAHNYVKHALHCLMHSRRFFASRCSWHFFVALRVKFYWLKQCILSKLNVESPSWVLPMLGYMARADKWAN